MLGLILVSCRLYRLVALTIFCHSDVCAWCSHRVVMTSCRIVLNFSPPDRSMRFVTPSGPGDSSGVSLCISFITSFLWMGDPNSGFICWIGLAISWAILVADDWMEWTSFMLNGDSLWRIIRWPEAYGNLCHTRGSNIKGTRVHIRSSLDELSLVPQLRPSTMAIRDPRHGHRSRI